MATVKLKKKYKKLFKSIIKVAWSDSRISPLDGLNPLLKSE